MGLLKNYKRPNDKIHELLNKEIILPVKKGLYITGKSIGNNRVPKEVLANILYGPSYVSLDYALSHYGLIPEMVHKITSVCIKPAKKIKTPVGLFTYTRLPLPYYSFGIKVSALSDTHTCLIAEPEKALCDKIICTAGLQFRSKHDVYKLLVNDWRIDEYELKALSFKKIMSWLSAAPKKQSLMLLTETLKNGTKSLA